MQTTKGALDEVYRRRRTSFSLRQMTDPALTITAGSLYLLTLAEKHPGLSDTLDAYYGRQHAYHGNIVEGAQALTKRGGVDSLAALRRVFKR